MSSNMALTSSCNPSGPSAPRHHSNPSGPSRPQQHMGSAGGVCKHRKKSETRRWVGGDNSRHGRGTPAPPECSLRRTSSGKAASMTQNWHDPELPLLAEAKRINDPERALKELAKKASTCTRCMLYKNATQTVFGEGPADAALMLVGEQPGDQEDLAGRPFVGPAGKVLDQALAEAGIDRSAVYVTNAVKHFKWTPKGKTRLHQKPDAGEIDACRPWVLAELKQTSPD